MAKVLLLHVEGPKNRLKIRILTWVSKIFVCFFPQKGDRVFAFLPEDGGYAEYVACKEKNVYPLSEKLTFSQGSGLCIPYFTAYRALVTK
jgi:NADPH:quinone reductase-like Zn-dependent oxidoreductase